MITRIQAAQAAASRVITTTPTCNGSKSRAMQYHTKTANSTTITTTTTKAGQMQKHMTANTLDATMMMAATATTRARRAATTLRHCSMAALQVLMLVCALPPPLQPLRLSTQRWAGAVEALPITSKPIEGTAENLAWQEWLMLPAEQKQLEKSRKVTPKSIFSLPFRDCPPGHQLFQSRCIPTVNINQSDLLTQQVLGLFGGSNAGADTAYEIDYGDEEYDLGLGEGEPVMMYEAPPQPFNGGLTVGASNAQQPPARDEPLKFNLFQQKFPTNDYEADMSSGAMEGSGAARPLTELLATNGAKGERADVVGNDNDAGATLFNSTQFLDAVQGFFQRNVATAQSESNATIAAKTDSNANITDHNTRAVNGSQVMADLSAADDGNVPAFADGDIDAIILPAVGAGTTAKTVGGYAGGDLEPQRISLFKDDSSVHLVTTVIAQPASVDRAGGAEEDAVAGDLVAAAQQQENSIAQFLRADALLPLSSVAPYITTTTTTTTTTTARTLYTHDAGHATKTSSMSAKDEHPRSVTAQKASTAANDTDAQETSFITTTEPEGTTNFQIDETTVIEAQGADAVAAESNLSLLQTIAQQQQLELEKSKATAVEDVPSTTLVTDTVDDDETTVASDKTTTETETIINETTTEQNASEESVVTAYTTVQPLPSVDAVSAATTTPQAISASTYRFRHTPTVVNAAVTPIQLPARSSAANKQIPSLVTTVVPQTAKILAAGEEATTRVSADSALVNDVPRSGNNTDNDDLVNVVAASINSDTDNDSNKYKNAAAHNHNRDAEAASVTRDVNIAQELRMINELVKGNRQASATKMAATKPTTIAATTTTATTTQSTTILTPPTANAPDEEVQKAASAADNEQQASAGGAEAAELGEEVDAPTTTATGETATQVADASAMNESSLPAESSSEIVETTTITTATAQSLSLTKMESANQSAESATTEKAQLSESSSKKRTGFEAHMSAEPDYEAEATATDTEFMAATTLWSRIMPIFGFGASAVVADANAPAITTPTTTTTEVAEHTPIGSISSNSSSISSSSKSKNSLSEKSSSMEKNNNNNNIINNQKSDFVAPSRRNSKIIRIDHFSDNSVAAATAATTTNTVEDTDTAATVTKTTDDFVIVPEEHEPMEQSAYWWLPANWRLNRGTTTEEQPLLFRLWSAFPESQMKTKVST
ncbi:PREDICTED: protein folded gastrulation [Bactrocera latifrons]|uniref:protein folded gastrulation n=1 Tax=Bactrocera latifrons TaxID=174628 RepID=UPI0008DDFC28|nr:PREDICTED: protein folded gastrulation [Bactrocera latifrons]XP_018791317.1 PREDICTED: protein folded gastrulation [Bactrocera latifrons]